MKKRICAMIMTVCVFFCMNCFAYADNSIISYVENSEPKGDILCETTLEEVFELEPIALLSESGSGTQLTEEELVEEGYDFACKRIKAANTGTNRNITIDFGANGIKIPGTYVKQNEEIKATSEVFDRITGKLSYESGILLIEKKFGYGVEYYKNSNKCFISSMTVTLIFEPNEIQAKRAELESEAAKLTAAVPESASDLEKILITHDFICSNTEYDEKYMNNYTYGQWRAHSMYGILIDHVGVCQGYAEAMCYLLEKLDVDCVACVCDKMNHVWNCVKVDNKWYHVDATHDDSKYNGTYYIGYKYFLNGIDDVIKLRGQYKITTNDLYYPSGVKNTKNSDYKTGWVFNYLQNVIISEAENYFFIAGFSFVDNRLQLKIISDYTSMLNNEMQFEFDGLRAMDYAVSKPYEMGNKSRIVVLGQKKEATSQNIKMLVQSENGISSESAGYKARLGTIFSINDFSKALNNSKLFFWDSDMRPLSYVVKQ